MSNTRTIARNTAWYGVDQGFAFIQGLVTSIALARYLGPERLGFVYLVNLITTYISQLGSVGIPATVQKYVAEYLGKGDTATAGYIYKKALGIQSLLAFVGAAGFTLWVWHAAPIHHVLWWDMVGCMLMSASVLPMMADSISAQANQGAEDMAANLPSSLISNFVFFLIVIATVWFRWGVLGFGAATLAMRLVNFFVRFFPAYKRFALSAAKDAAINLHERMTRFSGWAVVYMLLYLIVWDRSEMFLLSHFCKDPMQLSYYQVAFSMAERLLMASNIVGNAIYATIFAQYGRDSSRLPDIAATSFRYLSLLALPLHMVFTAFAVPVLFVFYGHKFMGAAAVMALAPMLSMAKAFASPAQSLLQSHERQSSVVAVTLLATVLDVSIATWLILSHGAVGACIGSGVAQYTAAGLLWAYCVVKYGIKIPWAAFLKIALASLLAAFAGWFVVAQLGSNYRLALIFGLPLAAVVLYIGFFLLRILNPTDRDRFQVILRMMPARVAAPVSFLFQQLIRAEAA